MLAKHQSETGRKLQALSISESQVLSRDLPKDTVLKGLHLRLSGSITTTFASGTPVADAQSTFDNIVPNIGVFIEGGTTIKSVRPHLMRMQQLFTSGVVAERKASAGASAATDNNPTADSGFTYGTTGQLTTVAESIFLPFEMVYCASGLGRETTWLDLRGVSSAELRLTCASYSKFLGFGNTAPVVYSASTLQVDILTVEAQNAPEDFVFDVWKQTTKDIPFSSETQDSAVDINRGNLLTGIMLFAKDGAAGSATTATGKLASNLAVTKINLKINGSMDLRTTDFKALQALNRKDYKVNAPYASNVSILDGVAHINLLSRQRIDTAFDLRRSSGVDNCQLFLTTNTASNVSYTNPVIVTVMTEEIVKG